MNLKEYLFRNDIMQKDFSTALGISYKTLWSIINGVRMPSLDIAVKIEEITHGVVKCKDLIPKKGTKDRRRL